MPLATVLFVCVHNAGRSQMAAGFLRHLAGDRIQVLSAGTAPKETINPDAIRAMAEIGIDISGAIPQPLREESVEMSDYVITMGCGDTCPYFPGRTYLDWPLDDPAAADLDGVRRIRDQIRALVDTLVAEIDSTAASGAVSE